MADRRSKVQAGQGLTPPSADTVTERFTEGDC
jgi:hypothetical protein